MRNAREKYLVAYCGIPKGFKTPFPEKIEGSQRFSNVLNILSNCSIQVCQGLRENATKTPLKPFIFNTLLIVAYMAYLYIRLIASRGNKQLHNATNSLISISVYRRGSHGDKYATTLNRVNPC